MLNNKIYNLVLYNYALKQIVRRALKSRNLVNSPPYRFYYDRMMRHRMREFSQKPFRVMLENTNLCDANCSFCPHKFMKRPQGTMGLELSKKIIDGCKDLGIEYLTIYGFGEPLLDKYFFQRIEYAKAKGIKRVTTNTNASYMNKEKNKLLLDSGIDEIYISFDAFTDDAYKKIRPNLDFATVKENILDLIARRNKENKNRPLVVLSFVENETNQKEISDYLIYWKNKADYISISSAHNWTGDIDEYSALNSYLRDPCRLLWTDMFIFYNGDVPLCCNDYEGRIILGNVRDASLEDIWSGKLLNQLRQLHIEHKFSQINICKNCNYNYHHKSNWWVRK